MDNKQEEPKSEQCISIPQSWWTQMLIERDALKTEKALLSIKIQNLVIAGDALYSLVHEELNGQFIAMTEWEKETKGLEQ
jgi:hypothetical protein